MAVLAFLWFWNGGLQNANGMSSYTYRQLQGNVQTNKEE